LYYLAKKVEQDVTVGSDLHAWESSCGLETASFFSNKHIANIIISVASGGPPFHPSIRPVIRLIIRHPSSSSRKKNVMEEEDNDDKWRQQQFIQTF
jgi:hypothetical protein